MSLSEISKVLDDVQYLQPKLDEYYYLEREQGIEDYMRRYAMYHKHLEKLGIIDDKDHPYHRILHLGRVNLDWGLLSLHKYAFTPAVELLGSEEQVKKWVPLARHLKILGAYA